MEFSSISETGFLELGFGVLSVSGLLYFYPKSVNLVNHQLVALGLFSFIWVVLRWSLKIFIYENKRKGNTDNFSLIENQVKIG